MTENKTSAALYPVEEIVQSPLPGCSSPSSFCFSPDDSVVACLFSLEHSLNKNVFVYDTKNGKRELAFAPPDGGLDENNISPEEKLRRERSRERGLGVTRFEFSKTSSKRTMIMVPLPSGIYLHDLSASKAELVLPSISSSPVIDPHLSPDGRMIAYVKNSDIYVMDVVNQTEKKLTDSSDDDFVVHGLAEYIAQEEMDRKNGYWWSQDSKYIAFTQVDSKGVPLYRIMHQGKSSLGDDAEEDHAYPFAGGPNVKVRLGVVNVSNGAIVWMNLHSGEGDSEDEYLARVNWMCGNALTAQVLNRHQTKLKIYKFEIRTGDRKTLHLEENNTWVNLHDMFTPLDKHGGFIWASEITGFRHLYLHDASGKRLGAITQGDWMVESIAGVNEATGVVYFTATKESPLGSNLYYAKMYTYPNDPVRLTQGAGKHVVVLDHHLQTFVDVCDSLESPPQVSLRSLADGKMIFPLFEQAPVSKFKSIHLQPPEVVQISATDGTCLFGALYKPDPEKFGPPPYKAVVSVYGGPSVQIVCDSWLNTVDLRAQYLRNRGVLVWKMDNRGTVRRGLKFEAWMKKGVGRVDTEDQVAGVEWLVKSGWAKAGHVGVYGWSYGGYMSAMLLAKYPGTFGCGVSGAPVTAWDGYDTFYTEKYMGLPADDAEAYERSAVMHHVGNLEGKLMIVHGMIDENVHFRHTARLVNELIAAGKSYELLLFPDERHMPRRLRDRVYMEERIWDFFQRNLSL